MSATTVASVESAITSSPGSTPAPALKLTGADAGRGASPASTPVIPPFKYADLLSHGPYGDFRDALVEDGFVVIPHALTPERAADIRDRALSWLESFGRGFDRNKPETFGQAHLPQYGRGGMYFAYGIHHEQWLWDCRLEPGVKGAFAKLWGTEELVTSFDGGAIMMPHQPPMAATDASWPHLDLNPSRVGFHCAQGIVNLSESGPDDGGLVVMKGSSKLMKEFFDEHGRPPVPVGEVIDRYLFTEAEKQWFFDRGCTWHKVCASPGDLIMWRSDTMHQGCPPTPASDTTRVIAYVCMAPADALTDQDRAVRADAWAKRQGTTHSPHQGAWNSTKPPIRVDTGDVDPDWQARKNPVRVTDEVLRLAGQLAY